MERAFATGIFFFSFWEHVVGRARFKPCPRVQVTRLVQEPAARDGASIGTNGLKKTQSPLVIVLVSYTTKLRESRSLPIMIEKRYAASSVIP